MRQMSRIASASLVQPPALKRGDTIAVIAPASAIEREPLEAGCIRLRELGFAPRFAENILSRDLFFAGDVRRRVDELHAAFADPAVHGILCARGGYGANYLLPHLDLE